MAGLLHDPATTVEHLGLPDDLRPNRALDTAQRVHVLRLGPGAPPLARAVERGVHVAAQRTLLHPDVTDRERAQDVAQGGDIRAGHLRREGTGPGDRLGNDLDERDAGAVVVDQGVVGPVNAAGRADVRVLARVLL